MTPNCRSQIKSGNGQLFVAGGDQAVQAEGFIKGRLGFLGIVFVDERAAEYPGQGAIAAINLLQVGAVPHVENLVPQTPGVVLVTKTAKLHHPRTFK